MATWPVVTYDIIVLMQQQKILLIEDDQLVREAYEESLRSAGYQVDSAVDGEEGLNKARVGGYDLIFLDIMLPKLDGLGILRGLRENPPTVKNGPILLLTNLSHDPVITEGINLGASSALIKSDIDPGQLIAAAKGYLEASAAQQAETPAAPTQTLPPDKQ